MGRVGGSEDLEARRVGSGAGGAAGVAHLSSQFSQQGSKAMGWRTVVQGVAGDLGQRCSGALGWCHRIAGGFGLLIDIGKHQLAPDFTQVPLDIIGEHA